MPFAIRPGQTVLFVGDSITDCGRRAEAAPLGDGYVSIVADLITARHPAHSLTIINKGIGGNTVADLAGRWSDDVIRHRPDWVSVKIGINDIHCWLRSVEDRAVSPEQFSELYDHILDRVKRHTKARIVLVDPFYISTDRDPMSFRSSVLKHLPKYIKTVAAMSRKYRARRVRTHDMFQRLLKHHEPDEFCPEPVHPNRTGHTGIAHAWLQTMGW